MAVQQLRRHVSMQQSTVYSPLRLLVARPCSAKNRCVPSQATDLRLSRFIAFTELVPSHCRAAAVNRRRCLVWASAGQKPAPVDHQEDVLGSEAEFDEECHGEIEEYEEYEKFEEYEEGEEDEEEEGVEQEPAATAADSRTKHIPQDATTVPFTKDDFVDVGLISRAHGVKGEVKIQLITDQPKKRLGTAGKRLWLLNPVGRPAIAGTGSSSSSSSIALQRVTVQSARVGRSETKVRRAEWIVKFNEVADRDQAASLSGCKLLLALCDREAAPRSRDEFFITDLVGLRAVDATSQQLVGIVTEVYDSAASYSLLRVRLAPSEEDITQSKYRSVLVPFVAEIVPDVDMSGGRLQVTLPEGLLDTASSKKLRRSYTAEQQAQLRKQLMQGWQPQPQTTTSEPVLKSGSEPGSSS